MLFATVNMVLVNKKLISLYRNLISDHTELMKVFDYARPVKYVWVTIARSLNWDNCVIANINSWYNNSCKQHTDTHTHTCTLFVLCTSSLIGIKAILALDFGWAVK